MVKATTYLSMYMIITTCSTKELRDWFCLVWLPKLQTKGQGVDRFVTHISTLLEYLLFTCMHVMLMCGL